jgi:glycerate dehydrogenase
MNIVVLDGYTVNPGDNPWDPVRELGPTVVHDRTPGGLVVERAREADAVLTNKTPVDAPAVAALERLRYIGVLATGYNVVDLAAASARGIVVTNVPEYSTDSVAQHVVALLLSLTNQVALHDQAAHAGEWQRSPDFSLRKTPLTELAGKTLSIIGFGRIGRRVGMVGHALGMRLIASTPHPRDPPGYPGFEWVPIETAFERADVVSLNCPLTPTNAGFVNAALLARMKPTAILINASRGPLVHEADLADALRRGVIGGAAVDVAEREPIPASSPLLGAPNLVITPHIAWATLEARRRLMAVAAANLRAFRDGQPVNRVA